MPFPFSFIFEFKYGVPLMCCLVMAINAIWLKFKVARYIKKDPSLERGYNLLIGGIVLAYLTPIAVLTIALTFGPYNTIYDILKDQIKTYHEPIIMMLYITVLVEAILIFVWTWFLGGAAYIARHPGLGRGWNDQYSANAVKVYAILGLGLAIAMVVFNSFFLGQ